MVLKIQYFAELFRRLLRGRFVVYGDHKLESGCSCVFLENANHLERATRFVEWLKDREELTCLHFAVPKSAFFDRSRNSNILRERTKPLKKLLQTQFFSNQPFNLEMLPNKPSLGKALVFNDWGAFRHILKRLPKTISIVGISEGPVRAKQVASGSYQHVTKLYVSNLPEREHFSTLLSVPVELIPPGNRSPSGGPPSFLLVNVRTDEDAVELLNFGDSKENMVRVLVSTHPALRTKIPWPKNFEFIGSIDEFIRDASQTGILLTPLSSVIESACLRGFPVIQIKRDSNEITLSSLSTTSLAEAVDLGCSILGDETTATRERDALWDQLFTPHH